MRERREDRAPHGAAGDDHAGAHHRVQRLPAAAVLVEDELRRLGDPGPGVDRPVVVVHVEDRVDRDQVHVRVVVGVERADVAPVAAVAVGRARHLVGGEVVDLRVVLRDQRGDDVAAEVVLGGLVGGVGGDRADQRLGREHVVAHRGEDLVGRVGQARRRPSASRGRRRCRARWPRSRSRRTGRPARSARAARRRSRPCRRRCAARPSGAGPCGRCGRRRRR